MDSTNPFAEQLAAHDARIREQAFAAGYEAGLAAAADALREIDGAKAPAPAPATPERREPRRTSKKRSPAYKAKTKRLHAAGRPTRMAILDALDSLGGELKVGQVAELTGLSHSCIIKATGTMRQHRFITGSWGSIEILPRGHNELKAWRSVPRTEVKA